MSEFLPLERQKASVAADGDNDKHDDHDDDQVDGEKDDDTDDHDDHEVQIRGFLRREHQQASVDGDANDGDGDEYDQGDDEKDDYSDFYGDEGFCKGSSRGRVLMFPFSDDDDGGCRADRVRTFCFEKEFERFFSTTFSIILSITGHT